MNSHPGRTSRRRSALLLSGVLLLSALAVSPAARADAAGVIVASRSTYVPGDDRNTAPAVLVHGFDLLFVNIDVFSFGGHSVTSDDGLFDSGAVDARDSVTISVEGLPPGTYGFYCTVHLEMKGQLVIV